MRIIRVSRKMPSQEDAPPPKRHSHEARLDPVILISSSEHVRARPPSLVAGIVLENCSDLSGDYLK